MTAGEMAPALRLDLHIVIILITDGDLSLIRIKQSKKDYTQYGDRLYDNGYVSAKSFFGVPVLTASNTAEYRQELVATFEAKGPGHRRGADRSG